MTPTDEDRQIISLIFSEPENQNEVLRAQGLLDQEILRSRFNRERAEQIFLFVIDNCVQRHLKGIGIQGVSTYVIPKPTRAIFAKELCEEYVQSRANIQDQRKARCGIAAYLLGK